MTTVTKITQDATLDDLSAQDYADIFAEIRERMSLDKFCALVNSQYSKAQWSKYEHGGIAPTRQMRNELRRAVGKPELPPTVAEATAQASPDAAVWQVGEGVPEHVIMVASAPVTLSVNGSVQVALQTSLVTGVTSPAMKRKPHKRLWVPDRLLERYTGLRTAYSDADIIEAGIKTLEAMP